MEVVDCEKTAFDRARRFMRGEAAGPRLLYLRTAFGLPDIKHILLFYALVDYHGVWYALSRIGLQLGFYKLHTVLCCTLVEGILQKSRQKECMQITQVREKTSILEQFWDIQTELVKRSKSSNLKSKSVSYHGQKERPESRLRTTMKKDHKAGEYLFQYHIQPSFMRGDVCKAHNEETTPANSRAHFGDGTQYPVKPSSSEQQDELFSLKAKRR